MNKLTEADTNLHRETDLEFQIASGGLAAGRATEFPELVMPMGILKMVERAKLIGGMFEKIGLAKPAISLLPSVSIETADTIKALGNAGFKIGSIDTPEVRGLGGMLRDCFDEKGNFIGLGELPNHIGYTLLNTTSLEMWQTRMAQALQESHMEPIIIRTSAPIWTDATRLGTALIQQIRKHVNPSQKVYIPVEINAYGGHTYQEYLGLIARLNAIYGSLQPNVHFGISFDTAHVGQVLSKEFDGRQPTNSSLVSEIAEDEFARLTKQHPEILLMVELDQVDANGNEHVPLNAGTIDLGRIMKLWGTARTVTTPLQTAPAVIEQNPRVFGHIIGDNLYFTYIKELAQGYNSTRYTA